MTDEQIIAAIKEIDTPLGRVGLIHAREDGAIVPTYVAKQFAAAIAAQLAAPVAAQEPDAYIVRTVERAIKEATQPQGMGLYDGMARIPASILSRLLQLATLQGSAK